MELIMALFVLIIVWCIGFLVGNKQLLKKEAMGIIGKKPKTQTDYQNEHKISPCVGHELESQKENDKEDINFMYNWIREKSGK